MYCTTIGIVQGATDFTAVMMDAKMAIVLHKAVWRAGWNCATTVQLVTSTMKRGCFVTNVAKTSVVNVFISVPVMIPPRISTITVMDVQPLMIFKCYKN